MVMLRWFSSRAVRQAVDVRRQIDRLIRAQRDLLAPSDIAKVEGANLELRQTIASTGKKESLQSAVKRAEETANRYLKAYPHARTREHVEVFLVTGVVVLALRTFFFQPMAIPSGSAQPTLCGIEHQNLKGLPDAVLPGGVRRFFEAWWHGTRYYHKVAGAPGELTMIEPPRRVLPFVKKQVLHVGGQRYTIWFPPDDLARLAALRPGQRFATGEDIIRLKVRSGDHLFVNRLIYNLRHPRRGEIIVFSSHGLPRLIPDTHYIKRLVAMDGERVRIGDDRHLVINGERLDASDPGFENVYGFNPADPPRDSVYSGHLNGTTAVRYGRRDLAQHVTLLFPDQETEYTVRKNHYLVLGDNTLNSMDSRTWGDIPREKVIGRASFVFWPISDRFGWGYR
jgi:signal peptidase I